MWSLVISKCCKLIKKNPTYLVQIKCLWINHLGKGNFPFTTNPIFLSCPEMNTVSHICIIPDLSFSVTLEILSTHTRLCFLVCVCMCARVCLTSRGFSYAYCFMTSCFHLTRGLRDLSMSVHRDSWMIHDRERRRGRERFLSVIPINSVP